MSVQFFRLWPRRPPDGSLPLGLSCDDEGLLLAGDCRLIEACLDRDGHLFYRARAASELNALLTAAYGEPIDATSIYPAVEQIAKLMTERNWSRARLAALHLRLPELADTTAAARVLKVDALLKVTASFDPDKHPRWPKGSQEGHGGEFRPADGGDLLLPVADREPKPDPKSEPDPWKLLTHVHHWFPQAIEGDLEERGLLSRKASKLLDISPLAKTPVVQDITDKSNAWRVHFWDEDHVAYNRAVGEIVENFIKAHQITAEYPMTDLDIAELLVQITGSTDKAIVGYREAMMAYIETQNDLAARRMQEYRALPSSGRSSKKVAAPEDRTMSAEEQATPTSVEALIYEHLLALGLEPNRDYWFYDKVPGGNTFIGFERRELLTPDVIVACKRALASLSLWAIRIGLINPETSKFQAVASITADHISQLCFEDWAILLVSDASLRGSGWTGPNPFAAVLDRKSRGRDSK